MSYPLILGVFGFMCIIGPIWYYTNRYGPEIEHWISNLTLQQMQLLRFGTLSGVLLISMAVILVTAP